MAAIYRTPSMGTRTRPAARRKASASATARPASAFAAAWMDEEYLASDPVVSRLARKGTDFTEQDKQDLRMKQIELLGRVLPEYGAAATGQIEISATPFYHPILPLLCDSDMRVSQIRERPCRCGVSPSGGRTRTTRTRAPVSRASIRRAPDGLWPSEGSVSSRLCRSRPNLDSNGSLRTRSSRAHASSGFGRDGAGVPSNADKLYSPLRVRVGGREMVGFFRDHYLSDLVGFVYSRMMPRPLRRTCTTESEPSVIACMLGVRLQFP